MMRSSILLLLIIMICLQCEPLCAALHPASFADFDRRARNGERLNVVFFGASLTWGANASDPQLTSYRARMAEKFEAAYPKAHFKFWDAAIGGTGSQLGVFRMQRDVLQRNPDLVFLDFSANDDIYSETTEPLASYEAIVRRLVEAGVPVVQVIFPFKWNVVNADLAKMKRRDAHLAIASAYNTSVGDAIELAIERVKGKNASIEKLWPVDGVHPGDVGYQLFADAAWQGFENGVKGNLTCRATQKMLHAATYTTNARVRLSSLGTPPVGWRVGMPNLTSAFFDFLMSRWLDDEVIGSNKQNAEVARWKLKFHGSTVMLLGEGTLKSGKYRVTIDGVPMQRNVGEKTVNEFDAGELARRCGGNVHHAQVIATGLDATREHTLEIEPVFEPGTEQELRFESVCVAGGAARVSVQ